MNCSETQTLNIYRLGQKNLIQKLNNVHHGMPQTPRIAYPPTYSYKYEQDNKY